MNQKELHKKLERLAETTRPEHLIPPAVTLPGLAAILGITPLQASLLYAATTAAITLEKRLTLILLPGLVVLDPVYLFIAVPIVAALTAIFHRSNGLAAVTAQASDLATTFYSLNQGLEEANILMQGLADSQVAALKLIAIGLTTYLWRSGERLALKTVYAAGLYLCCWNLYLVV